MVYDSVRFISGLLLVALVFLVGCAPTPAAKLGVEFVAAEIPADLEEIVTPGPEDHAYKLLEEGETKVNMHAYYRECYRAGFDDAVEEILTEDFRTFRCLNDVYVGGPKTQVGCDAFWLGYESVYLQKGHEPAPNF